MGLTPDRLISGATFLHSKDWPTLAAGNAIFGENLHFVLQSLHLFS